MPRFAVAGMAVLAIAALTAAACDATSGARTPASSPSAVSPQDTLLTAAAALNAASYEVAADIDHWRFKGRVDPTVKAAELELKDTDDQEYSIAMLQVGAENWLKMDFGPGDNKDFGLRPDRWMKIDTKTVRNIAKLPFVPQATLDVLGVSGLLSGLSNAVRIDPTHYSGTIDLHKSAGVAAFYLGEGNGKVLGDKAAAVPFTATLDEQGRLAGITLAAGEGDTRVSLSLTLSKHGAPSGLTKPAANATAPFPSELNAFFRE